MQAIELLPGTVLKAGYEQVFISPELYDVEDQEVVDFVNEDGELIARGVITYSEELRFDDLRETDFDDLEASREDLLEQLTVRDSNFLEESLYGGSDHERFRCGACAEDGNWLFASGTRAIEKYSCG